MSWAVGENSAGRDIGYGVPCICDHPGCGEEINRGLSHVCGDMHDGGERGCGLYFCEAHLHIHSDEGALGPNGAPRYGVHQLCERCQRGEPPFVPTADTTEWLTHKLTDESWQRWRNENPEALAQLRVELEADL
jgi:hypothetical protein